MRRFLELMLIAAFLTGNAAAVPADSVAPFNVPTEDSVKAIALQWYTQMQAGQLDRTQLAAAYSAQLTDGAVREMSRKVNLYGASPNSAQVLQSRTIADQKFYLVKLIFPRRCSEPSDWF